MLCAVDNNFVVFGALVQDELQLKFELEQAKNEELVREGERRDGRYADFFVCLYLTSRLLFNRCFMQKQKILNSTSSAVPARDMLMVGDALANVADAGSDTEMEQPEVVVVPPTERVIAIPENVAPNPVFHMSLVCSNRTVCRR